LLSNNHLGFSGSLTPRIFIFRDNMKTSLHPAAFFACSDVFILSLKMDIRGVSEPLKVKYISIVSNEVDSSEEECKDEK